MLLGTNALLSVLCTCMSMRDARLNAAGQAQMLLETNALLSMLCTCMSMRDARLNAAAKPRCC